MPTFAWLAVLFAISVVLLISIFRQKEENRVEKPSLTSRNIETNTDIEPSIPREVSSEKIALSATVLPTAASTSPSDPPSAVRKRSRPKIAETAILPPKFVVLDLETTGLSPYQHEIIEIGAIKANLESTTHPTFQRIVRPRTKLPLKIVKMTGITQEMIEAEGCDLSAALADFIDFIEDLPLVTFNARFDMAFLQHASLRLNLHISNRYTCALTLAREAWPGLPSYRLGDLAKLGGLSNENTHRALGDCERAMIIFMGAATRRGKRILWHRPSREVRERTSLVH